MLIIALLVIIVPQIYILYSGVYLPVKMEAHIDIKDTANIAAFQEKGTDFIKLTDAELPELRKAQSLELQTAFQKNRLDMAQSDSVAMSLNLADSTIFLEIKGVPVRKVRVVDMDVSKRFRLIRYPELLDWVSSLFILQERAATIPVAPITVKEAPKDTAEANQLSSLPSTPEMTEVHFKLEFDRNLLLQFDQVEDTLSTGGKKVRDYFALQRKSEYSKSLKAALGLEKPDYHMKIRFLLDGKDARAIYMALPAKAQLALFPDFPSGD